MPGLQLLSDGHSGREEGKEGKPSMYRPLIMSLYNLYQLPGGIFVNVAIRSHWSLMAQLSAIIYQRGQLKEIHLCKSLTCNLLLSLSMCHNSGLMSRSWHITCYSSMYRVHSVPLPTGNIAQHPLFSQVTNIGPVVLLHTQFSWLVSMLHKVNALILDLLRWWFRDINYASLNPI